MGRVPHSEFTNSRARFQRLSDQEIYGGWVQTMRNDHVVIIAEDNISLEATERFLFQVQGPSADAYFIATSTGNAIGTAPYVHGTTAVQLVELPALRYEFRLITQIQLRDAKQAARKAVETMIAHVSIGGKTSEVLVADASAGGMGIIAWEEVQQGDIVKVEIKTTAMQATFMAEVRHCRPEQRILGAYRVGLHFQKPDRLSLMAWRKLTNP
jgi:hypothetical protein